MYSGRIALRSSLFYAKKSGKKENIHVYMISSMKKYVNRQPVYYEYKCETGRLVLYFFSKYLIIIYDDNSTKYSLACVNLIEKCHMLDIMGGPARGRGGVIAPPEKIFLAGTLRRTS